jgi:hypothetical protein
VKELGLTPEAEFALRNGALDVRLALFAPSAGGRI